MSEEDVKDPSETKKTPEEEAKKAQPLDDSFEDAPAQIHAGQLRAISQSRKDVSLLVLADSFLFALIADRLADGLESTIECLS